MNSNPLPLVLTIQSHVAYGHVGNSAAVFPLQRLGLEAVPIHTVQFSNHTGYGAFTGQVFDADHVRDVVRGLRERGVLARCSAVLSGYLGDAGVGAVILETVEEIRAANGAVLYCCDPVMGDVGRGVFVRPGIPDFLVQRAVAAADIITPNHFEFELIAGRPLASLPDAVCAARGMIARPDGIVCVTSVRTPDIPADRLATIAVTRESAWVVETPFLPLDPLPNGMGDVFSALFLAQRLRGRTVAAALAHAVGALYALVQRTPIGARDVPLVLEQNVLIEPPEVAVARAIA